MHQNKPCVFAATLPLMGHKKTRRFSRIVVKPDYQGVGIGTRFTNEIARYERKKGYSMTLTTSNIMMIEGLKKNKDWVLTRKGRASKHAKYNKTQDRESSSDRITTSWRYICQH